MSAHLPLQLLERLTPVTITGSHLLDQYKALSHPYPFDSLFLLHLILPVPYYFLSLTTPEGSVDDEAWFCRPDCKHPKMLRISSNQRLLLQREEGAFSQFGF